ncbi:DUF1749-domain-containing protein [Clavulina sp. PMI_390]|nr:DUF1749-domain-containing protein [Clavulina sp. PMI_390]
MNRLLLLDNRLCGLTDGLGSLPYLPSLSQALEEIGWTFVDLQLSSSHQQYGFHSLESDAVDIGSAVKFLRDARGKDTVVLMGHSTGCQDAMWYATVKADTRPAIAAAILQAPVSDVELYEEMAAANERQWLDVARKMVQDGKGDEFLPRAALLWMAPPTAPMLAPPFTAYRYTSLFDRRWVQGIHKEYRPELMQHLPCRDESYPASLRTHDAKISLLEKWQQAGQGKISPMSQILLKANHRVDSLTAQNVLIQTIVKFVVSIV